MLFAMISSVMFAAVVVAVLRPVRVAPQVAPLPQVAPQVELPPQVAPPQRVNEQDRDDHYGKGIYRHSKNEDGDGPWTAEDGTWTLCRQPQQPARRCTM